MSIKRRARTMAKGKSRPQWCESRRHIDWDSLVLIVWIIAGMATITLVAIFTSGGKP